MKRIYPFNLICTYILQIERSADGSGGGSGGIIVLDSDELISSIQQYFLLELFVAILLVVLLLILLLLIVILMKNKKYSTLIDGNQNDYDKGDSNSYQNNRRQSKSNHGSKKQKTSTSKQSDHTYKVRSLDGSSKVGSIDNDEDNDNAGQKITKIKFLGYFKAFKDHNGKIWFDEDEKKVGPYKLYSNGEIDLSSRFGRDRLRSAGYYSEKLLNGVFNLSDPKAQRFKIINVDTTALYVEDDEGYVLDARGYLFIEGDK